MIEKVWEVEETRCWTPWLARFFRPREFGVSWDGETRGRGRTAVGVPQRSPLSPVLFLIWMAPILQEMERRLMEELPNLRIEFPSYVDDLHCGLYDEGACVRGGRELDRRESMGEWLDRASVVIKEVGAEFRLPLAEEKEERLILREKRGRRGRRGTAEKVKWLGVLLDDELDFGPHWEYRVGKARKLLGQLVGGELKLGYEPPELEAGVHGDD